jgi:hypothetical protein
MAVSLHTIRDVTSLLTEDPDILNEWDPLLQRVHPSGRITSWIDPDKWYGQNGARAFIFTADGEIFYAPRTWGTHGGLIAAVSDLWNRYEDFIPDIDWFIDNFGGPPNGDEEEQRLFDAQGPTSLTEDDGVRAVPPTKQPVTPQTKQRRPGRWLQGVPATRELRSTA